jgi:hypothetical protein
VDRDRDRRGGGYGGGCRGGGGQSPVSLPVYFYGRSDYDLVSPSSMRTYRPYRASLKGQDISGSLYVAFRRGIR